MADIKLPDGKKLVYLFDSNDTAHPYMGKLVVDANEPVTAGQTEQAPVDETSAFFNTQTNAWVNDVVIVYGITAENKLGTLTRRPKGYTLADHETFVKPEDGLYDPTWNGTTWVGISAEEYYAKHPAKPLKPTEQDKAMAGLLKDVMGFKAASTTQDTLNANVMKDLMAEKQKSKMQDQLNAQLLKDVASLKLQLKNATTNA